MQTRRRKTPRPPIEATVRLGDWASRGSVASELDGRQIHIDRGIPGELVAASIDRRRNPWRGVVDEVLEASPARVPPPCPYYLAGCGGCQWQHLRYEAQVESKRGVVNRALADAGLQPRVGAAYAMRNPWRYRQTAAIAIGWEAGFRPRGRRGIVEIHDCAISHPLIGHFLNQLNDLLDSGPLPNYHGKVWLDCTVVGSAPDPGVQVVIQGIPGLTLETHPELPAVAQILASLSSVHTVAYRHRSGTPVALAGDLTSGVEVAGRVMRVPAGSFFQTNVEMIPLVIDRMRTALQGSAIRQAADVYGGVGTFGLPLAADVEHMTLLELDPIALAAAEATADDWKLENVSFVSGHAERALPHLPSLDLVVVDPPRSGLGTVVTDAIISNAPSLVFYVSCAPASLARDLALLHSGGYVIRSLDIFDFYPQTYHIESMAILER